MGTALVRLAAQHPLFPLDVEAPTLMHKVAPSWIQPLSLIHQLHLKILSWYWLSKFLSLWGLAKKLGPQSEAKSWLFLYAPLEWPHETPFDSPPSLHSVMMVDVTPWLLSYIKMLWLFLAMITALPSSFSSSSSLLTEHVNSRRHLEETPIKRPSAGPPRAVDVSTIPRFLYL